MPQIGPEGQARLAGASALVIGAGGLGSTLLLCLAGAGVGRIGIIDDDVVSESNLNRQFLFTMADLGREKAFAAAERLAALNPHIQIVPQKQRVNEINAPALVVGWDIVILAVDNFEARLAVNKACCEAGITLINGGVDGFYGTLQIVQPGVTPCLECLYGAAGPEGQAEQLPSLGAPVAVVSSLMADAALVLLLGLLTPLGNDLLCIDGESLSFARAEIARGSACPACGKIPCPD
ncbi:MAG: HesA/MoeB/ThiF family protein [Oscillospiraceae bacterium]|nr:HesA/MoeB/ThiF family protein [Oscillospiraceae bacterium]